MKVSKTEGEARCRRQRRSRKQGAATKHEARSSGEEQVTATIDEARGSGYDKDEGRRKR